MFNLNLVSLFSLPYAYSEEYTQRVALLERAKENEAIVKDMLKLLPDKLIKFTQEKGITFKYNPIVPLSVNAEKASITVREDIELIGFPYYISIEENLLYSVAHEIGHILSFRRGMDHHDEELAWIEAYNLLLELDLLQNEAMFDAIEAHCLKSYGIEVE